jgi:hypothetical protein
VATTLNTEELSGMTAHHGNTPAAWTGVTIFLIGFTLGGIALVVGTMWLFWASVVICAVSPLVGKIMQAMGYGADAADSADTASH